MTVEILTFLGLALVLEGMVLALAPGPVAREMRRLGALAPRSLRLIGVAALAFGALALAALAAWAGSDGTLALAFPRLRALFGWFG